MKHQQKSQVHRNRKLNGGYQGLGGGLNAERLVKGYQLSGIRLIRSEDLGCNIMAVVDNTV